jgi:hypothetical protein
MKNFFATIAFTLTAAAAQASSPYAGEQTRDIKALSAQDVAALLAGQGSGYAKAAELNGYPGPAHVLELAAALGLTDAQRQATERLMNEHKARATKLGAEVVEAERTLDQLFARRQADASAVERATTRIAQLQATLRAEHLKTHLVQTRLLSAQQIERYQQLRGYAAASAPADQKHEHKHNH